MFNFIASFIGLSESVIEELNYWLKIADDFGWTEQLSLLDSWERESTIKKRALEMILGIHSLIQIEFTDFIKDTPIEDIVDGFDTQDIYDEEEARYELLSFLKKDAFESQNIYIDSQIHLSTLLVEFKSIMSERHNKTLEHFFKAYIEQEKPL